MLTFSRFLAAAAQRGEVVNTLFEERLFHLVGVLHRITDTLAAENIPHELIGGLAVLVHVEEADPTHATLTRDVDLMVRRADLGRIKQAAAKSGFRFRHTAGLDMLLYGHTDSAKNAVHLIFSGEKVRPNQATANPPIAPERKRIQGKEVMIIPVADLARMKDWSIQDRLMELYEAEAFNIPSIKRAIVRFTLANAKDTGIKKEDVPAGNEPSDAPAIDLPAHCVHAQKCLEDLEKRDPKTVHEAKRFFLSK